MVNAFQVQWTYLSSSDIPTPINVGDGEKADFKSINHASHPSYRIFRFSDALAPGITHLHHATPNTRNPDADSRAPNMYSSVTRIDLPMTPSASHPPINHARLV